LSGGLDLRVGFIGAGNMAEALARGVLSAKLLRPDQLCATDPALARQALFRDLGIQVHAEAGEVLRDAEQIWLCVKPQQAVAVLSSLAAEWSVERHVLISICAGLPIAKLAAPLPEGARIVRVMPNTPMLVGSGACGLSAGPTARPSDVETTRRLLDSCAVTTVVPEAQMDAVTAVSGSGPAYFFYLLEALIEGGIAEGLSAADARELAVQTCLGAAQLARESHEEVALLRQKVTSPGGTTQAALEVLEASGVKANWVAAVRRAAQRSRELGAG
jgi:pyrroline-5-carboxylate reductase